MARAPKAWLDENNAVSDRILYYLASHPDEIVHSWSLIKAGICELRCTVSRNLTQLAKDGIIERVGRGQYKLRD